MEIGCFGRHQKPNEPSLKYSQNLSPTSCRKNKKEANQPHRQDGCRAFRRLQLRLSNAEVDGSGSFKKKKFPAKRPKRNKRGIPNENFEKALGKNFGPRQRERGAEDPREHLANICENKKPKRNFHELTAGRRCRSPRHRRLSGENAICNPSLVPHFRDASGVRRWDCDPTTAHTTHTPIFLSSLSFAWALRSCEKVPILLAERAMGIFGHLRLWHVAVRWPPSLHTCLTIKSLRNALLRRN